MQKDLGEKQWRQNDSLARVRRAAAHLRPPAEATPDGDNSEFRLTRESPRRGIQKPLDNASRPIDHSPGVGTDSNRQYSKIMCN